MIASGGENMFSLEWFYQLHFYIIFIGVLSILSGVYIVKFKKDKSWRIKRHRLLTALGSTFILAGVVLMYLGKSSADLGHFSVPHAFGGLFAISMIILTAIVANIGMKGHKKMMNVHRWLGRITSVLIILVSIVGFTVLMSYI